MTGNRQIGDPPPDRIEALAPAAVERRQLLEAVRDFLRSEREIEPDRVVETASFRDDFEIDSLDLASMALELERRYAVRLDDDRIMTITTVGDALDAVMEELGGAAAPTG